jgi:hypothetical protein
MRRAAARVARRLGSRTTMRRPASHSASSRRRGTMVVLPEPGGATSTAAPRSASASRNAGTASSTGRGAGDGDGTMPSILPNRVRGCDAPPHDEPRHMLTRTGSGTGTRNRTVARLHHSWHRGCCTCNDIGAKKVRGLDPAGSPKNRGAPSNRPGEGPFLGASRSSIPAEVSALVLPSPLTFLFPRRSKLWRGNAVCPQVARARRSDPLSPSLVGRGRRTLPCRTTCRPPRRMFDDRPPRRMCDR